MGLIFSVIKIDKPEAWEIGKNYYRFQDLFPPCAFDMHEGLKESIAADTDIPGPLKLLASFMPISVRMEPGRPTPFSIQELYPTVEEFMDKMHELKGDKFTDWEAPHWRGLYRWAGNDKVILVADFEDWSADDLRNEANVVLCDEIKNYRFMDSWNGDAGRKVEVYEEEDGED